MRSEKSADTTIIALQSYFVAFARCACQTGMLTDPGSSFPRPRSTALQHSSCVLLPSTGSPSFGKNKQAICQEILLTPSANVQPSSALFMGHWIQTLNLTLAHLINQATSEHSYLSWAGQTAARTFEVVIQALLFFICKAVVNCFVELSTAQGCRPSRVPIAG